MAALSLASCWIGRSLYSPADARTAIPPGVYRATSPEKEEHVYRVSLLPDGLTQFDSGEKPEVYGFAPLDRDSFVGWVQIGDARPDEDNQLYGLLVRQSASTFMIYLPTCSDEQGEIARNSGATIEAGMSPTCRFPTRASLENAMRQMARDPKRAMMLERIH